MLDIAKRVGCAVSTLKGIFKKGNSDGLFVVISIRVRSVYTTVTASSNVSSTNSSDPNNSANLI